MAFYSFQFIFGALPVCYACFLLAHRLAGWPGAFRFLALASLAFYAQWSPLLLAILIASVISNFGFVTLMDRLAHKRKAAGTVLTAAIAANLLALGYLKYVNFFVDIANSVGGSSIPHIALIVPIGVSFYTFIQIGYLIETYAGQVQRHDFGNYLLFATFFPCVTAGPLVLQREMMEQMNDRSDSAFDANRLAAGLTMFCIGLFKKVVFADQIAPFADAAFNGVVAGQAIGGVAAWLGALCYTLQLYFDFSGYSDMAIGLGCMFGLMLPLNFDSPLKATNISDFWRRWHMTMTRFFTTYIYTPLAMSGMRATLGGGASSWARYLRAAAWPAIVTFLVAGVWHGAGWTYVVYGLIHGLAIAIYLGWSRLPVKAMPAPFAWALTMAVVVTGLVVFRAPDLASAGTILAAMWTFGLASGGAPEATWVTMDLRLAASAVVVLGMIVMLMPNSQQILHRSWISSDHKSAGAALAAGLLSWRPSWGSAIPTAFIVCWAIGSIGAGSKFLYYQF